MILGPSLYNNSYVGIQICVNLLSQATQIMWTGASFKEFVASSISDFGEIPNYVRKLLHNF